VKTFALSGEPIAIENYSHGVKDGICSYYQNGYMYQQTTYNHGKKHGVEKFYIDGDTLAEETEYNNGCKYGPSVVFCDGTAKTTWYFNDEKVSKATFDQYDQRDMMITANK
jgi:antitoxin component YwqK of YwqJK toxin-antitoxin module